MQIHEKIGTIFAQRYQVLTQQMLAYVVPLIGQIERSTESALLLDAELSTFSHLFEVALQQPDPPFQELCDVLKHLNKYFNIRGLYFEQVGWAQSLLTYFLEHDSTTGDMIDLAVLNTIASGYTALGKPEDALEIYDFILELYASDPNHPGLATICFNAANAYHSLGDTQSALRMCQRALAIDQLQGDQRGIAMIHMLMADLANESEDALGIFQHLKQAINIILELDNAYLHAQITGKMALYMARYYDWQRAEGLFKQAVAMWRQIGDDEQLAVVLFNYAGLLHETDRRQEALKLAHESIALLDEYGLTRADLVRAAIESW
jgi:tetratricopeptide (TPR) repeat protein